MKASGAAAVLVAFVLSGVAQAREWPRIPLPEDSTGELVTSHMSNNGIDMRVSTFNSRRSREEVLAFYRGLWGDQMVESEVGEKIVLGHAQRKHFVTVEVSEAGPYAEGTIGIAREPDRNAPPFIAGEGVDRPGGTEVLSDIRFFDTPSESRVLVLNNQLSPFVNLHYFADQFRPSGWRVAGEERCLAHATACTAEFERERGGGRMTLTLRRTRNTGTQIVMLFQ